MRLVFTLGDTLRPVREGDDVAGIGRVEAPGRLQLGPEGQSVHRLFPQIVQRNAEVFQHRLQRAGSHLAKATKNGVLGRF
jgi:hypothetical protein